MHESIDLHTRSGVIVPVPPSSLVVWIDETGEELFSDPSYPLFGLGGCAVLSRDYGRLVAEPWRQVKRNTVHDRRPILRQTLWLRADVRPETTPGLNSG